jgi:hypothetical protein
VTLTTGGLSQWNWNLDQQGPGHAHFQQNIHVFQCVMPAWENAEAAAAAAFSARRQDLPSTGCKQAQRDCLRARRPILKKQLFSRFRKGEFAFREPIQSGRSNRKMALLIAKCV